MKTIEIEINQIWKESDMEELKPCPFCGGDAIYRSVSDMYCDPYRKNCIECLSCGVSTKSESRHPDDGRSPDLIEAWNTRADSQDTVTMPRSFVELLFRQLNKHQKNFHYSLNNIGEITTQPPKE